MCSLVLNQDLVSLVNQTEHSLNVLCQSGVDGFHLHWLDLCLVSELQVGRNAPDIDAILGVNFVHDEFCVGVPGIGVPALVNRDHYN